MRPRPSERLAFLVLATIVFGLAAWEARSFPVRARVFPQVIATGAFLLGVFEVIRSVRAMRRSNQAAEPEGATGTAAVPHAFVNHFRAGVPYILWILGYYAGIAVFGFYLASGAFITLFLVRYGRVRWYIAAAAVIPVWAFLLVLSFSMNIMLPASPIETWLSTRIPGVGGW